MLILYALARKWEYAAIHVQYSRMEDTCGQGELGTSMCHITAAGLPKGDVHISEVVL
jgi:hypothetical protein